jgi:hypothetical protein
MLHPHAYETYKKKLKEEIFSSMRVNPQKIMKNVFGIKHALPCPEFYLVGTNSVTNQEIVWGKFYTLLENQKMNRFVVIFECLLKESHKFTGCVELLPENTLCVRSFTEKDLTIMLIPFESKSFAGMITPSVETSKKIGRRIRKEHWKVLQRYFELLNA